MPDTDAAQVELRATWSHGRRFLGKDPLFGPWVREIGTIRVPVHPEEPFYYLARAICYQQLAGAAAATIHGRFCEALKGDISPAKVLRTRESTLRGAGLSRNKLAAIRDLASKIRSGEVEVHDLGDQPDEEVVRRLVKVRGIGEWTAHMYLMFKLFRRDVWPVGDTVRPTEPAGRSSRSQATAGSKPGLPRSPGNYAVSSSVSYHSE